MWFSRNSGNMLIATGILHNVIGFVMGWSVFTEIVSSGFVNTINNNDMDRSAIFWFLFGGFMMIIMGKLMQHYLDNVGRLPKSLGVSLLIMSIVGGIMMPRSGFWVIIPQAVLIIFARRRRLTLF